VTGLPRANSSEQGDYKK